MVYTCPLCGSASTSMPFQKHYKCKNCGLIFLNINLNVTDLVKIYDEKYFREKSIVIIFKKSPLERNFSLKNSI
jgi:DNA-directed RNA polymerase subunit RPC12/RpoP